MSAVTMLDARTSLGSGPADDSIARRWDVALFVAVLAPYLLLGVSWSRSNWFPIQDQAVLAMRIEDLYAGRLPLLGAFSRYEWSHPGPIWFYLLAPFRVLGGGDSWIVTGSVLLFGAGPASLAVLTRRRFGSAVCAVAMAGSLFAVLGAGSFAILVPWNPHLAFAWLPVFLVLCIGAARGRMADLAAAAFVGSALVQLHVGYVVLVSIPFAAVILLLLIDRTLWSTPRAVAGRLFVGGARAWWIATALMWLPPVIDQMANGRRGNFWRLGGFFVEGSADTGAPAGWSFAARVLGGAAAHSYRVVGGAGEATDPYTGWVLPGSLLWTAPFVLVVVAAALVAFRTRSSGAIRAMAIAVAAMLSGFVALARLLGDRWPYLFVWRYQILWFAVATSLVVMARAVPRLQRASHTGRFQRNAHVAVAVVVVVSGVLVHRMAGAWEVGRTYPSEPSVRELTNELQRGGPPTGTVTMVRFGSILVGVGDGVLHATRAAGWDVGVLPELGYKYGDVRVHDPEGDEVVWFVTETSADTTVAGLLDGAAVLAAVTPLDDGEEDELVTLQTEALRAMIDADRPDLVASLGSSLVSYVLGDNDIPVDPAVTDRLTELNEKVAASPGGRMSVVAVPATTGRNVAEAVANDLDLPAR